MTFLDLKEDMAIAEAALAKALLDQMISPRHLLCEVYCLTPFRWQTFYVCVYDGSQYTLLYAKPYIANYLGLETVSTTFRRTLEADAHIGYKGDIFCGIRRVSKEDSTIKSLVRCLPQEDEIQDSPHIAVDGISTIIVNQTLAPPKTLYFRDEATFSKNHYTDKDAKFLHNLFACVEALIGNLRNAKQ